MQYFKIDHANKMQTLNTAKLWNIYIFKIIILLFFCMKTPLNSDYS